VLWDLHYIYRLPLHIDQHPFPAVHAQVGPDNLERILYAASYLDIPGLVDACAGYMRSLLSLATAVPLLRLANRYGILALRAELVCSLPFVIAVPDCLPFTRSCSSLP
jgi:hypothetical protein